MREQKFNPWVCHACGVYLFVDWRNAVFDDCYRFICRECNGHYCDVCFYEHMQLGHSIDIGRELDMFDFLGEA